MRKLIADTIICFSLALMGGACSDADYVDKYADPSKTTVATCDKLMTGVFYAGKQYTYNTYWRMFTWDNGVLGKYAQTIGFMNSPGAMYSVQDSYANDRWENFYSVLAQYRTLENVYREEEASRQADDKIFLYLSEIFVYDHLSQLIDLFGDVPFTEAGYMGIRPNVKDTYPRYERAVDLYKMMMERLGVLNKEIGRMKGELSPIVRTSLPNQDYINKGDLDKWMKYANNLRLRLAVRVASQGELTELGKKTVAEILDNGHSLSATFEDNISLVGDNGSTDEFNFSDAIREGYKDHSRASQAMLDMLLTEERVGMNDFRLPIMYSKNAQGTYKGLSPQESFGTQEVNVDRTEDKRVYSRIDSTTVIYNQYLRHPVITTAEVDFLRAEAYQKGWARGNAKRAFVEGVWHSTQYYFDCNAASKSSYGFKGQLPAEEQVVAFAGLLWEQSEDKYELIIGQKWLNFGFLQSSQAWNEVRRTGYPKLHFQTDETAQLLKTVPARIKYPASERNYNTVNYQEQVKTMGGKDDAYIKLFWAK